MTEPIVKLSGVRRTFGRDGAITALDRADLEVMPGDFVAIHGRSGSGKSTLLNILGLMDTPTSGAYRLEGHETSHLSAAERSGLRGSRIGFVFQGFHLISSLTVAENVAMAGMYSGVPRPARYAAAIEMLDRVGLGHRVGSSPAVLSGGERQRVAIARAFASRPSLLLADEPTGNLDTRTSSDILGLFTDLHRSGITVVMITHDPLVAAVAERRCEMVDGVLDA